MKQSAENAASGKVGYRARLHYGGVRTLTVCVRHAFKRWTLTKCVPLVVPRKRGMRSIHGVVVARCALLKVRLRIRHVAVARLCFQLIYVGIPTCSAGRVLALWVLPDFASSALNAREEMEQKTRADVCLVPESIGWLHHGRTP